MVSEITEGDEMSEENQMSPEAYNYMIEHDGVLFNEIIERAYNQYKPGHALAFVGMLHVAQQLLGDRLVAVRPSNKEEVKP